MMTNLIIVGVIIGAAIAAIVLSKRSKKKSGETQSSGDERPGDSNNTHQS